MTKWRMWSSIMKHRKINITAFWRNWVPEPLGKNSVCYIVGSSPIVEYDQAWFDLPCLLAKILLQVEFFSHILFSYKFLYHHQHSLVIMTFCIALTTLKAISPIKLLRRPTKAIFYWVWWWLWLPHISEITNILLFQNRGLMCEKAQQAENRS